MYKIILLLLIIVLLNCKEYTYCLYDGYQGGHIIEKACRYCEIGDHHNHSIYYKRVYDNDSCSYLNTQKDKKK